MKFFINQSRKTLAALAITMSLGSSELLAFINADQPLIGMSSTGDLIAVWSVYDNLNSSYVIRASTWDSISGWSANETISTIPGISFSPSLAVNDAGDAAVIWTALDSNNFPTLQGKIYYNGVWESNPTQFSASDEILISYKHTLSNSGSISVIWSSYPPNSNNSAIYALTGSTVSGGWNVPSGITELSD